MKGLGGKVKRVRVKELIMKDKIEMMGRNKVGWMVLI